MFCPAVTLFRYQVERYTFYTENFRKVESRCKSFCKNIYNSHQIYIFQKIRAQLSTACKVYFMITWWIERFSQTFMLIETNIDVIYDIHSMLLHIFSTQHESILPSYGKKCGNFLTFFFSGGPHTNFFTGSLRYTYTIQRILKSSLRQI